MTPGQRAASPLAAPVPSLGEIAMAAIQRAPLAFLRDATRRFPDIVFYRTGGREVALVNHPSYLRHVLQHNARNYTKQGSPDLLMLRPMLGAGLMTTDGEVWLRQRRMLQPAFHHECIAGYVAEMVAATEAMRAAWRGRAGTAVDAADDLSRLTLGIVASCLFGYDLKDDVTNFGKAVEVLNRTMAHFDPWDGAAIHRFQDALRAIGEIAREIIARRAGTDGERTDLLSLLLAARDEETGLPLTDSQMLDQVVTFLMAGHETTAKALTWTLHLLSLHPEVSERARAEAVSVLRGSAPRLETLDSLEYCGMVIQEAMRVFPPVWSMTRVAREDDEIGGHRLAAGTLVIISPYALHRRADLWPDPERFDPERFRPEAVESRPAFAYCPFSGGTRVCIGQRFATMEMKVVLAMVLQRFHFAPAGTAPVEPEALVTLRPRNGLPLTLRCID